MSSECSSRGEVAVCQVYCVVYRLVSNEWQVTGPGWSVVSIYRDVEDGSHRMVGFTVESHQLVLNVNVTPDCRYKKKSEDFHKLRDEEGRYWGFGFYKREDSLREAIKFMTLLQHLRKHPILSPPPQNISTSDSSSSTSSSSSSSSTSSSLSISPLSQHPLPLRASSSPMSSFGAVHHPQQQQQQQHVVYEHKVNAALPPIVPVVGPVIVRSLPTSSSLMEAVVPPTQRSVVSSTSLSSSSTSSPRNSRLYPQVGVAPSLTSSASDKAHVSGGAKVPHLGPAPLYPAINPTNSYPGPSRLDSPLMKSRASPPPLLTLGVALKPQPMTAQSPSSAPAVVESPSTLSSSPFFASNSFVQPLPRRPDVGATTKSGAATPTRITVAGSSPSDTTSPTSTSPVGSSTPQTSSPRIPSRPTARKNSAPEPADLSSPVLHRTASVQIEELLTTPAPVIPLGSLTILPPKPSKAGVGVNAAALTSSPSSSSSSVTALISDPHAVTHTVHVQFDPVTRTYRGLPAELASRLHQQFGLPVMSLDRQQVPGYLSRIPTILIQLRAYLIQQGGLAVEGIFRLACDGEEAVQVKKALNEGKFDGHCKDIHVIANLMKVWYRELPVRILDGVDSRIVEGVEGSEGVERVMKLMGELQSSLLCWLLDVCVEVVRQKERNLMGSKSLGIVWSPNLFTENREDPLKSLHYSQKVAHFMLNAIEWRMQTPHPTSH